MAWLVVNKFSLNDNPLELTERLFCDKPIRAVNEMWTVPFCSPGVETIGVGLPRGSIEKLIGRKLTWEDEPVKFE